MNNSADPSAMVSIATEHLMATPFEIIELKQQLESISSDAANELKKLEDSVNELNKTVLGMVDRMLVICTDPSMHKEQKTIERKTEQLRKELDELTNQAYYQKGREEAAKQMLLFLEGCNSLT